MTVKEVAEKLKINPRTVMTLCKKGLLIAQKRGREWYIFPGVPQTVTVKWVAKMFGSTERYIQQLCKDGRLGARRAGKQWRIPKQEAIKLFEARL